MEEYRKTLQSREDSPMGQDSAVGSGANSVANSVDECNHKPCGSRSSDSDRTILALDLDFKSLKLQSQLSRSDSNLYQSCRRSDSEIQVDILSSLQKHGSRTSLECQNSRSCSQSTQSTSTSAEFSLSNFNSICDGTSEFSPEEVLVSPGDTVQDLSGNSCDKVDNFSISDTCHDNAGLVDNRPMEHLCTESKHSDSVPEYSPVFSEPLTSHSKSDFVIPQTECWDEPSTSFDQSSSFVNEENGLSDEDLDKKYFTAEFVQSDSDSRSRFML